MNIYHVARKPELYPEGDTFSDFVVVAESEEVARNTSPNISNGFEFLSEWPYPPHELIVTLLGIATPGQPGRIVCSSFHAG